MAKKLQLSEQLRKAIDGCGLSRYALARETGISQTALSLFMNGRRGLSLKALDRLGESLELSLTVGRKALKKKGE